MIKITLKFDLNSVALQDTSTFVDIQGHYFIVNIKNEINEVVFYKDFKNNVGRTLSYNIKKTI